MLKQVLLSASALAILTACNAKDGNDKTTESAVAATATKVEITKGNPANVEAALGVLGLTDNGILQYSNKTVDGANVSFDGVSAFEGGDFGLNIAKLTLDGLDKNGDTATFGRVIVDGLTLNPPGQTTGLSLGSIELVNPSTELSTWISDLANGGELDTEMPDFWAMGFDKLKVSNLSVIDPENASDMKASLASFEIDGNSIEKIGSVLLQGFEMSGDFDGTQMDISLGKFSITGLDKSRLTQWSKFSEIGSFDENTFMNAFNDPENLTDPGYDDLSLSNVAILVEGIKSTIPSLSASTSRYGDGTAKSSRMAPMTMTIEPTGESDTAMQFKGAIGILGLDKLDLIAGASSDISKDHDTVSSEVSENYFGIKDFATIRYGGEYSGLKEFAKIFSSLDMSELGNDPQALFEAYAPLAVSKLDIHIENMGGIDTLLSLAAQQQGMDLQEVIDEAKGAAAIIPAVAASQGYDAAMVGELLDASISFLEDPKTLKIGLKPDTPLNLESFSSQEALQSLTKSSLGLTASNE